MASQLNQDLYLGALPASLRFSITKVSVFCAVGGYSVQWRDTPGFNVSNRDGRCFNLGQNFQPSDPNNTEGKKCERNTNLSAEMSSDTAPIRLGQMSWSRVNTLDILASRSPGFIELAFNVSNISGGVLAKGTLKATPTEFRALGRPDNIDFVVTWEKHPNIKAQTTIDPNIGVDPPPVHLSFIPGTAKNTLGATVTVQAPTTFNFIASWMIRGILYGNKKMIEFAFPGGVLIVKIIELPETIDIAVDLGLAIKDLRAAVDKRDLKAAVRALVKAVKGLRDLSKTVVDTGGAIKDFRNKIDRMFAGTVQTGAGDAAESFTEDIAEIIISELFAKLNGGFTRRNLARRKHLRYR